MNIIETVKKTLSRCPKIDDFCNGLHVDFSENKSGDFGLYSSGDALVGKDILGNEKRKHSFVLYANGRPFNEFDRLAHSAFLLELNYWLEKQKHIAVTSVVDGKELPGEITKMSCANAMLFAVPTGNVNDGVTYQLQIYVEYTIESEEF